MERFGLRYGICFVVGVLLVSEVYIRQAAPTPTIHRGGAAGVKVWGSAEARGQDGRRLVPPDESE